jgi:hypothetical protein
MKKPAAVNCRSQANQHPHSLMDTQQIIGAHAKRLGLSTAQLTEIMLHHVAGDLLIWTDERERSEPGSVWYTGDIPQWLEPYLPRPWGGVV